MVPWTPSQSIDLLTHICPPFLYPKAVGKHHEHQWPPQLPSQYPIVQLKSERSSSLAHSKSNGFMVPWTPSQSIDLLTHICPPFLSLCRPSTGPPYLKRTISNSLNDDEDGLLGGNRVHRRIQHPLITPPAYLNHPRPPKILDLSRSRARAKSSTIATPYLSCLQS